MSVECVFSITPVPRAVVLAVVAGLARQGLTLVHIFAQPEP